MERYSIITQKNPREIVLLKARPCTWGKCSFCDYILDNAENENENFALNKAVLSMVEGRYGFLEVINSGSAVEMDEQTLRLIADIAKEKNIAKLSFESHYRYREELADFKMKYFAEFDVLFKCGIETFDEDMRNRILNKGVYFKDIDEIKCYFQSICLLECIKGQSKQSIANDIRILTQNFEYGCVNIFCDNNTSVKRDEELVDWFYKTYKYLEEYPNIDVLYHNTDFGVGQ